MIISSVGHGSAVVYLPQVDAKLEFGVISRTFVTSRAVQTVQDKAAVVSEPSKTERKPQKRDKPCHGVACNTGA